MVERCNGGTREQLNEGRQNKGTTKRGNNGKSAQRNEGTMETKEQTNKGMRDDKDTTSALFKNLVVDTSLGEICSLAMAT